MVARNLERRPVVGEDDRLLPLRKAHDRGRVEAEGGEGLQGGGHLPPSPVDHEQVGKGPALPAKPPASAPNHLLHRAVIVVPDEPLYPEAAVAVAVGLAIREPDHGGGYKVSRVWGF